MPIALSPDLKEFLGKLAAIGLPETQPHGQSGPTTNNLLVEIEYRLRDVSGMSADALSPTAAVLFCASLAPTSPLEAAIEDAKGALVRACRGYVRLLRESGRDARQPHHPTERALEYDVKVQRSGVPDGTAKFDLDGAAAGFGARLVMAERLLGALETLLALSEDPAEVVPGVAAVLDSVADELRELFPGNVFIPEIERSEWLLGRLTGVGERQVALPLPGLRFCIAPVGVTLAAWVVANVVAIQRSRRTTGSPSAAKLAHQVLAVSGVGWTSAGPKSLERQAKLTRQNVRAHPELATVLDEAFDLWTREAERLHEWTTQVPGERLEPGDNRVPAEKAPP